MYREIEDDDAEPRPLTPRESRVRRALLIVAELHLIAMLTAWIVFAVREIFK
jgi:hypothetical protein